MDLIMPLELLPFISYNNLLHPQEKNLDSDGEEASDSGEGGPSHKQVRQVILNVHFPL